MKISGLLGAALSAGFMLIAASGAAHAQAGISQLAEITTAEAAQRLLRDPNEGAGLRAELEKNGIDPDEVKAVPWPGPIFNAEGGPLKIFNCTGGSIKVKTFNSNDAVTLVAYQEKSIGNGSAAGLQCATKSCKIKIGNGNVYSPLSGLQVLLSGAKLQTTNSSAVAGGCANYVKPKSNAVLIQGTDVVPSVFN
ncbi:hypothetical protein [Devosia sp. CN2-171]|uniref:hypothetical protein n=1 Tax=Devosia sp. CN2-171 TaxID=3400909 RepID=UPI003BF7C49F